MPELRRLLLVIATASLLTSSSRALAQESQPPQPISPANGSTIVAADSDQPYQFAGLAQTPFTPYYQVAYSTSPTVGADGILANPNLGDTAVFSPGPTYVVYGWGKPGLIYWQPFVASCRGKPGCAGVGPVWKLEIAPKPNIVTVANGGVVSRYFHPSDKRLAVEIGCSLDCKVSITSEASIGSTRRPSLDIAWPQAVPLSGDDSDTAELSKITANLSDAVVARYRAVLKTTTEVRLRLTISVVDNIGRTTTRKISLYLHRDERITPLKAPAHRRPPTEIQLVRKAMRCEAIRYFGAQPMTSDCSVAKGLPGNGLSIDAHCHKTQPSHWTCSIDGTSVSGSGTVTKHGKHYDAVVRYAHQVTVGPNAR